MLGAIAGDIIGSCWEGSACANLPLPLITAQSTFTDDTVCTIALADALISGRPLAETLRRWVRRYPNRRYGGSFYGWAHAESAPAYNSFANGGAMRVSPAALLATSIEDALRMAEETSAVTHNHPDGVQGARAIAAAIWYARNGLRPAEIRARVETLSGYDLRGSVEHRASNYGFSVLASETVPDALVSALEAKSYEGAIRNAIAIGGDSDTIACMAGGIAEALYGVPQDIVQTLRSELPDEMYDVLRELYAFAGQPFPLPGSYIVPVRQHLKIEQPRLLSRVRGWFGGR